MRGVSDMARIVVIGGGLIGLATATMVAKLGHDVTVLERDPAPPPDRPQQAWDRWERRGVMQFRQPHYLLPAGQRTLGEQLPDRPYGPVIRSGHGSPRRSLQASCAR